MKFRGISAVLVATVVAFAATTANAAKVGFIAAQSHDGNAVIAGTTTNANVPAGFVLYTVALKTQPADGTGSFAISLTFNGIAGTSPVQATASSGGVSTIEGLQGLIDGSTPAKINVGTNADTWLYTSPNNPGQLLDIDGNPATGNPGLAIPGLTANPLALTWQTLATPNGITNTTGAAFSITGPWGNPFADPSDPILAASQIGPNSILPIAQILVPVGSSVPLASGTSLGIGTPSGTFYNVLGTVGGDGGAGAFLSGNPLTYLQNPLALPDLRVPEPSTFVLAGLGIAGVLFARRRRK